MVVAVLFGLAITLLVIRWLLNTDPAVLAVAFKRSAIILVSLSVIFLLATGRMNFVIPLLVALLPVVLPALNRFLNIYKGPSSGKMTLAEAYEVLDLQPGASRQEIIEAHKRLIKKVHPDTGGSTYLTQKLNEAKDLLLGK